MRDTAMELGRLLRTARDQAGLTQAELAARLRKNQANVSQWESGKRAPRLEDLFAIARELGVDLADLLPQPDELRPQAPALMRALVATLELDAVRPHLERFLEDAEQLPVLSPEISVSADRPLRAADELLARAQLEEPAVVEPPIDVIRLSNLCGVRVHGFAFATEEEEESFSGLLIELENGPVIGYENARYWPRARFTIAHELGHHLLRHHDRFHVDLATDSSEGLGAGRLYDARLEREANDFAANVLMPATLVRNMFSQAGGSARALAQHFQVSPLAMSYRLVNLGLREPA